MTKQYLIRTEYTDDRGTKHTANVWAHGSTDPTDPDDRPQDGAMRTAMACTSAQHAYAVRNELGKLVTRNA